MNSTVFERFTVFLWVGASNAAASVDFKELTEAENDLVDLLG